MLALRDHFNTLMPWRNKCLLLTNGRVLLIVHYIASHFNNGDSVVYNYGFNVEVVYERQGDNQR